ncbi:MAG: sn-glycerol-3-phosphate ABC transporter ATP-binding protein UgpC [Verrucomicrobia bacterium]|nr:sn-glycerol-3-phosphate ABC transporter ATP-binding protein UgpC [Verrucomicrobiota bacterium]
MSKVILENLCKVFPGEKGHPTKVAVDRVSLEIASGEFLVLVGPSGCGKTTVLRMIAGLEDISSGIICIGGRRVNDIPPKDRDIAMVFQNYALYPHMTVARNMSFGLEMRGFPKEEIRRRVDKAARALGLLDPDNLLERKPKALSGGQRQRVALGRAMVREPQVFLFDEPLSNLDAKMRVEMRAEISRLHRTLGCTMIYVTHDQTEAMTMADRIVVMSEGRVQQIGTPEDLYHQPANRFVASFIGSPTMNFFRGTLQRTQGGLTFLEECHEGHASPWKVQLNPELAARLSSRTGHPILLGVRPEHLAPESSEHGRLELEVDLVEPMGAETFLYGHTAGHKCACRITLHETKGLEGKRIHLIPDQESLHFFDPVTGDEVSGQRIPRIKLPLPITPLRKQTL